MARETQSRPASEKKLEQYGVWVKVRPQEVLEAEPLPEPEELTDLDSPGTAAPRPSAPSKKSTLTADEEKLLDDLDSEMGPGDTDAVPAEEPLMAEGELPELDEASPAAEDETLVELTEEELPELDDEPLEPRARSASGASRPQGIHKPVPAASESEIEVTLSEGPEKEEHFDDLEALETELASVGTTVGGAARGGAGSAEILARIEEELRSIRTDLTQLRTELSGLRSRAATEQPAEGARTESSGGFFDEDEDETIALTGDELDNILNTADITEESADASTAGAEAALDETPVEDALAVEPAEETIAEEAPAELVSLAGPDEDILSYDTPDVSAGARARPVEEEIDLSEGVPAEDDTLVLSEQENLAGAEELEELPSELVLEDLGVDRSAGKPVAQEALETIPEMEALTEEAEAAESKDSATDAGDETIDLETLDIGEEPRIINAVAEQVDDLETVADAEPVLDEEASRPENVPDADDVLSDDVDLEALAAEAAEMDDEPLPPPRAARRAEAPAAAEEIEIPFESDVPKPSPDVDAELEQILDAEEVPDETEAVAPEKAPSKPGKKGAEPAGGGIPDNLKDDIRKVLTYMDHLLEALPDEKIQEFASSDYFVMYKKLFEDLGLGE
jgi:pilus assembly protein FimV